MLRQAFFNNRLIFRRQSLIVQLDRAAHEQLPLGNGQQGQLREHFVKAHAWNIIRREWLVTPKPDSSGGGVF